MLSVCAVCEHHEPVALDAKASLVLQALLHHMKAPESHACTGATKNLRFDEMVFCNFA